MDLKSKAISDCYMMAKREIRRIERKHPVDEQSLIAWNHVIRFCESTGEKSKILRDAVPVEIQGG